MSSSQNSLQSIQLMRGIAALLVVFYHVQLILSQAPYGSLQIYTSLAPHGLLGVNFFFVLSGFIILMAHAADIGQPASVGRYAYRRAVRIYPAYWVYLTGYIAAASLGLGTPDFSYDPLQMLSAYSLVYLTPEHDGLPLKVAWTLFHEVIFYAAFIVLLLHKRLGIVLFIGWALVMLALHYNGTDAPLIFSAWNLNFIAGMGAYLLLQKLSTRWALPLLGLGLGTLVLTLANPAIGLVEYKMALRSHMVTHALAFMLIVLGAALWEQGRRAKGRPLALPKAALFAGDASYSMYLVHSAIISAVLIIAKKLGLLAALPLPLVFWSVLAVAVIGGGIAYWLVERPLLRWLRDPHRRQAAAS